jgi:hypothetical protein
MDAHLPKIARTMKIFHRELPLAPAMQSHIAPFACEARPKTAIPSSIPTAPKKPSFFLKAA